MPLMDSLQISEASLKNKQGDQETLPIALLLLAFSRYLII
jgi:hypothetical protein